MRVKIHDTTYIFLFLSFLSGYFEYLFLLLITILIHEAGHLFFSILIDFKYDKIPDGQYLVLGDNRDNSQDSRSFGTIEKEKIIGKVVARIWPLNRVKIIK